MPDPQQPDYDALAKAQGGVDYDAIAAHVESGTAAPPPPTPQDNSPMGAIGRGLSNFWEQVNPIHAVTAAGSAIAHSMDAGPTNTFAQIGRAQGEEYAKAARAFEKGDYVTGARHGLAYLLPIVGPAISQQSDKMMAGDIAGGVGGSLGLGTALAAPELIKQLPAKLPSAPGIANRLESSAESKFITAISPKTGPQKARFASMAEKAAPEALRDPELGAFSRQGLQQTVASKLDEAEAALDSASAARNANRGFNTAAIIKDLEAAKARSTAQPLEGSRLIPSVETSAAPRGLTPLSKQTPATVPVGRPIGQATVPSPNAARIAAIDQAIKEIKQLGPTASYEGLRVIREAYDKLAKTKYAPVAADPFKSAQFQASAAGAADTTGVLRRHLAQFDPTTAAANVKYSLYRSLSDVLQATEEAERVRPSRGRAIAARIATSFAGLEAMGPGGALAGWMAGPLIDEALNAGVTTKIATARAMTDFADALRAGNAPKAKAALFRMASMTRTTAGLRTALAAPVPVAADTGSGTTP
jgi:hypothetical protein